MFKTVKLVKTDPRMGGGGGGYPNPKKRGGGKINGIHNRLSICNFSLATLDVSRGGWVGFKRNVTMTFLDCILSAEYPVLRSDVSSTKS